MSAAGFEQTDEEGAARRPAAPRALKIFLRRRKALEERVARSPNSPLVFLDVARHYLQGGKHRSAERAYRHVIEKLDPRKIVHEARAELAQLLHDEHRYAEALTLWDEAIRMAPGFASFLHGQGRTLAALGRAEPAGAAYRHALALEPERAEVWLDLGGLDYAAKRYHAAAKTCRKALDLDRSDPQAHYDLALARLALAEAGRGSAPPNDILRGRREALRLTRRAAKLAPEAPEPRHLEGRILLLQGRPDAARYAFEQAIDLNPYWETPYRDLADLLQGNGQRDAYLRAIGRLAQLGGASADELRELIAGARERDDEAGLVEALNALYRLDRTDVAVASELAEAFSRSMRLPDALRICEEILEIDPTHAGASAQLAKFALGNRGDYAGARRLLARSLDAHPDDVDLLRLMAVLEQRARHSDAARRHLEKAHQIDPQHVGVLDLLGQIYRLQKEWGRAVDAYRKAVSLKPDDEKLRFRLAQVLYGAGAYSECEVLLEALIAKDPHRIDLHVLKGGCRLTQKDDVGAVESWETAMRLSPTRTEFLEPLAAAYLRLGRRAEAIKQLSRLVAERPNDTRLRGQLAELLEQEGRLQEAIRYLREIKQLDPTDIQNRNRFERLKQKLEQRE